MEAPKLFNNTTEKVIDGLKADIKSGSRLSIAAASFSIYAYQALKEELENIAELRFIFTAPTFSKTNTSKQKREFYIPKLNRERNLFGTEFEIRLRNELSQKAIARECADWIRRKVCFKSNISTGLVNGSLTINNTEALYTYMPFNEFTTPELGCEKGNNIAPQIMRLPSPNADRFLETFNQMWHDGEKFADVTDIVIDNISNAYKENSPEFIYFVTLYNIFNEFLADISEDVLPNEATGFKSSVIWNKLYNFQKDAALAIINKLEKYNGCILADSVGLGKTYTAISVIKYYENRNKAVLVLCPKKLYDNWMTYRGNYTNNPLVADRLRYDVLYHTDLSRAYGYSNGTDLERINWGNYDLVVIDESHNFRNGGKVTTDENDENPRENRYLQLMNKVIRAGVKTKVLMLSATPVNNRFNDLKNQLALAYEGNADNINNLLNTENSIDDIFRQAQTEFNKWSKLPPEQRTTKALLDKLSFDFFEVLDSVAIARSRKHIEQYYDTADIGSFPKRLKPVSRFPELTDINAETVTYNNIYSIVSELNLAIYTPSDFIQPSKADKYNSDENGEYINLSRNGRERGLRRLMSINLLKRLESSVNSFRLTLQRISNYISNTIAIIDNYHDENDFVDDFSLAAESEEKYGLDFEEREDTVLIGGKKTKIALDDMDYVLWRSYLKKDLDNIRRLFGIIENITPQHDSKLQQLLRDIHDKFEHPINDNNRKIIIFTAFSDTAQYIYDNISQLILDKYGLHTALITGDIEARSTLRLREKLDFNKVLTLFSPVSKERSALYPHLTNKNIDVLVATDCISEGQNLQDCDFLINYDIHWNPVRIIQRFGRIDRIGSKNSAIQLVNYWPDMDLDEYINLKGRVEARMKVSVLTSTGDDNPISAEESGDLKYRRDQLQRLQEEVVDIEEMNTGVSIMDLGLNEFRLDLLDYMKKHHDIEHTPNGLHAVVPSTGDNPPGVVFVLKNRNNGVNIDRKNRLHPFYMVYIARDSNVVINHLEPKELLDHLRRLCHGKSEPVMELCRKFNGETRDGSHMGTYSKLLGDAISSIVKVKEQSDLFSFLDGDAGSLFGDEIRGLDDFELICFLVIK